jgi:hypothetical protein
MWTTPDERLIHHDAAARPSWAIVKLLPCIIVFIDLDQFGVSN